MKIIQINSVCGVGSTGRIVTDIHSALQNKGIESFVMYGQGESRACDSAIKISSRLDFYSHVVQTRLFDIHGFCTTNATQHAIKVLENLEPDIVHLHNIHGYYLNVEVLFNYLKQHPEIKVIWTLHDCWPFTGHCSYFDFSRCEKWKSECFSCPQKKTYPASYGLDNSRKNYQRKKSAFLDVKNLTIVTPSQWLAHLVKKSFLQDYHVQVVNNGIDLSVFQPRQSLFRHKHNLVDKFVIMGAALVWSPRKGFDDFIALAKMLPANHRLVMIGLPPDKIKTLPNNIIGIHRTDNPIELAEIYSTADVFFNPTYEDNYPTVNLEAIACGTPVITYNTGGSPESVSVDHGFVFAKGDLVSVVNAVKNLALRPFALGKLPISFDKDNFVDEMLALYHL
ncbi:glycosyltransferase [Shewanella sp. JNE10-2]|uniref:glycosyltransferase n=1 Tax=unclassified Shewanella TaxID=196818 RepID=UPI0020043CFD|nr:MULTISPECIES: glycosyltransferase [unclassified Shewanella]MCK7645410.1 glycosyltransferase [Shewanella sp. JNE3-1]UPO26899.1 glycosyltransferase [Shewanella sp. JNE10-2]UPO34095.1 glycosyltransferase [Shewanella sp. JNE7]